MGGRSWSGCEKMPALPLGQLASSRESQQLFPKPRQRWNSVAQVQQTAELGRLVSVIWQVGDQLVSPSQATTGLVLVLKLHFHASHVHTRRAVTLAAFAADAQGQCVMCGVQRLVRQAAGCCRAGIQLPGQRQPQGVGAPPGQVLFIPRHPVTGAHGACVKLAAVAVVVAHLHSLGKTQRRVAPRARRAGLFGDRVVLHIPGRPVQRRLQWNHLVRLGAFTTRRITH